MQRSVVERVEERLNAEAVARGKQSPIHAIPNYDGKLAAQPVQAVSAEIFIKVKGDFTVGARLQMMPGLFKLLLYAFVIVELAVYDDLPGAVLVRDGLIAGGQVDDAQACVPETYLSVRRYPIALAVRASMTKGFCRVFESDLGDRSGRRENGNNSTHLQNSFCKKM